MTIQPIHCGDSIGVIDVLPVADAGIPLGIAGEEGGHRDIRIGHELRGGNGTVVLHISQGGSELLIVATGVIGAHIIAVIGAGSGLVQIAGAHALAADEGLADDVQGVLGGPGLQHRAALAVAYIVVAGVAGEEGTGGAVAEGHLAGLDHAAGGGLAGAAGGVADHLAQAGLQIGGLAVRGAPAALAGLQDKEELAIGVGLLQPALLLKEGVGVRNAVGQGYDGDVGAEGGVLAHIELEGAAGGLAVLEGVGVIADDGVLIDFSAVDGQGAGLAAPAGVGEQIPVEIGGRGGGRGGAHRQAQDQGHCQKQGQSSFAHDDFLLIPSFVGAYWARASLSAESKDSN